MIVPTGRLVFWFGAVVLPAAAFAGLVPSLAVPSILAAGLFMALAAIDAAISFRKPLGLRLEFPEVARLSKGRAGRIGFRATNLSGSDARFKLALEFPPSMASGEETVTIEPPADGRPRHYDWPCTPQDRGVFQFGRCYVERTSGLGLWAIRSSVPSGFEARVYPDLFEERKYVAAMFLNRGNFGTHARRSAGQGRDFEKLREYVYGDGYDIIHWKATAKRGRPISKVFQVERTQEVYVLLDASRLSARPAGDKSHRDNTILERYITAALVLGIAARRQGDLFGLVTFSSEVQGFLRAKGGRGHLNACRDALYTLRAGFVSPDFDEVCSFAGTRLRRRALLVFLTSLDDPSLAEGFLRNMEVLGKKHLVIVNMIRPADAGPVFSDPSVGKPEDIYRKLAGHMAWRDLEELGSELRRKGVGFAVTDEERLCHEVVSKYVSVKERQLL